MGKWNTTRLIAAGSLGILQLLFNLSGSLISATTGMPLTSGFINVFTSGIFFAITCLLIREFGAATIMFSVYSVLALPLPVLGVSGFFPKLIIGPIIGLIVDIFYFISRNNEKLGAILAGSVSQLIIPSFIIILSRVIDIPGIEKTLTLFPIWLFIFGAIVAGGISGYLGYLIYQKIKNTSVVMKIQGEQND